MATPATTEPTATKTERCPECKLYYAPGAVKTHRRAMHGVLLGKTKRRTAPARRRARKAVYGDTGLTLVQAAPVNGARKPLSFTVLPMLVLEGSDGHVYLADRIK